MCGGETGWSCKYMYGDYVLVTGDRYWAIRWRWLRTETLHGSPTNSPSPQIGGAGKTEGIIHQGVKSRWSGIIADASLQRSSTPVPSAWFTSMLYTVGLFSSSRRRHHHLSLAPRAGGCDATVLDGLWQAGPHEAVWMRPECRRAPAMSACMRNKHFGEDFGRKGLSAEATARHLCPESCASGIGTGGEKDLFGISTNRIWSL